MRRCVWIRSVAAAAAAAGLAAPAMSGPTVRIQPVVTRNQAIVDIVPGYAGTSYTVNAIDSLSINNSGQWVLEFSGGTGPRSPLLFNNGATTSVLSEHWITGQLEDIPGLGPVAQSGQHSVHMNNNGAVIRNIRVTSGTTIGDSWNGANGSSVGRLGAIYYNNSFVLKSSGWYGYTGPQLFGFPPTPPAPTDPLQSYYVHGDPVGAPAAASLPTGARWGLPRLAAWRDEVAVHINDSNVVFMVAPYYIDLNDTVEHYAAVKLYLDASGDLLSTELINGSGQPIPSAGMGVDRIASSPGAGGAQIHRSAINNSGSVIYTAQGSDLFTGFIFVNQSVVLQDGDSLPDGNGGFVTVEKVYEAPVDINAAGDWVARVRLAGGVGAIVKSVGGVKSVIAKVGDTLPDIAPSVLTDVGHTNGAVEISDSGDVLWWGRFDAATSNAALFWNGQLLVRQGVTYRTDGVRVGNTSATSGESSDTVAIDLKDDNFDMSDNGRWVIFKVNGPTFGDAPYAARMEICPASDAACNDVAGACCTASGCVQASASGCAGMGGSYLGNFAPCSACPPANDLCESAEAISLPHAASVGNGMATEDRLVGCTTGTGGSTLWGVWYRFTAAGAGAVRITETGSAQDIVLALFSGSDCNSLTELGCTQQDNGGGLPVTAGQYWVLVGAQSRTAAAPTSPLDFTLDFVTAPLNDTACGASDLFGFPFPDSSTFLPAATDDVSVACDASGAGTRSGVWYRLQTSGDGGRLSYTETSGTDVVAALFTGAGCGSLAASDCKTGESGSFTVAPNSQYWILVGSEADAPAGSAINITFDFAAATGACCTGESCGISTQSGCTGNWLGADTNCGVFSYPITANGGAFDDITFEGTAISSFTGGNDDGYAVVELPFAFNFFGTDYTNVAVAVNGFVVFGGTGGAGQWQNTAIPNAGAPNNAAFVLWDDLIIGTGSTISYATLGAAPDRRFIVQWRDIRKVSPASALGTFQLALFENGNIEYRYQTVRPVGASAGDYTIGAESDDATAYTSYSAADLSDGLSLRLTRGEPVFPCTPSCPADFDGANGVQVADIFAFLRAWFAQDARANFDGMNGIQVADIFAFLRAWFAGC